MDRLKVAPTPGLETGDVPQLCDAYYRLEAQRIELNRRLASLDAEDPSRDVLWQELTPLPKLFRDVIIKLARAPVKDVSQLRAKAAILVQLLRQHNTDDGQIIPQREITALSLALAEAIIGSSG